MENIRAKIRSNYIEALYFVDKYLLNEEQLSKKNSEHAGFIVMFQQESEPYKLASRIIANEIGLSVIQKFGYVIYYQDKTDIIVKAIF